MACPGGRRALAQTFAQLQALYRAGRNGIWTFVLRNLVRPVWLSRPDQRADVCRQPALDYLSPSERRNEGGLREALQSYEFWVGGGLATQQDMWALFWARSVDRYLKRGGTIAFVLPYAALNAPVYAGLRTGRMGEARVRLTGGLGAGAGVADLRRAVRQQHDKHLRAVWPPADGRCRTRPRSTVGKAA